MTRTRLLPLLILAAAAALTTASCGSGEEAHEISQRLANENHALRLQVNTLKLENTHLHNLFLSGERWESVARLRPVGGTGGSQEYLRQCPRGYALAGFSGRAGALIDAISPICTPVDQHALTAVKDASPIETTLPYAGGPSGAGYERRCNTQEHIVGIKGRAGDLINNLQAVCQRSTWAYTTPTPEEEPPAVDDDAPTDGEEPENTPDPEAPKDDTAPPQDDVTPKPPRRRSATLPTPREHTLQGIGGGGGQLFERRCPKGWLAVGISGRNGSFVDSVALHCAPIEGATSEP